ncbi:MAG: hypothetical protein GXP26_05480 [Planctomycetes bacterium]|nr:hypothetical protein [Planctomycetota bacterium]
MPIPFQCSVCGFSALVEDAMAGRPGKCPECDAALRIPPLSAEEVTRKKETAEQARLAKIADELKPESKPTPEKPSKEAKLLASINEKMASVEQDVRRTREHVGCLLWIVIASIALSFIGALMQLGRY